MEEKRKEEEDFSFLSSGWIRSLDDLANNEQAKNVQFMRIAVGSDWRCRDNGCLVLT